MHIVILTGAGISAESGLGTFRDPGGLWEQHDPMSLATPEAFARDPALVHRFYNWRRQTCLAAEPNAAHHALARLERGLALRGDRLTLVTQNVDDLHDRAGSTTLPIHGRLLEARCLRCGDAVAWRADLDVATACPSCGAVGGLRPNIVWFGEMPWHLEPVDAALANADHFVAIGTSGSVYPAAGYAAAARARGIPAMEINLTPADNARRFDVARYGKATVEVPRMVEEFLGL